jgi:beta-ketoacyl-acyl-carrier-protein synthase II
VSQHGDPQSPSGNRRVVVTGLGAVSPLGNDLATTWAALIAGKSGIDYLNPERLPQFEEAVAGEVRGFEPKGVLASRSLRSTDYATLLGLSAAMDALADADLRWDDETGLGPRCGAVFGSGIGGVNVFEKQAAVLAQQGPRRIGPFTLVGLLSDSVSGHIAILTGARGPNMAVLAASATGAAAIGEASEIIRRGDADVMVAGATESPFTATIFSGFSAMRGLAPADGDPTAACKPFDLNRRGFVVSEGSGAFVLESLEHARARGTRIYAELAGYGCANDAFDMIASEPSGRGPAQAMATALQKAGIEPEEVGYVNAHGTGSRMNDGIETLALKKVLGEHANDAAISSTKSMTGHLMGAAGALEAVFTVLALRDGIAPPTTNYETPDPECDLDYVPNMARMLPDLEVSLTHSIGLGGHNAALVFRKLRE